MTQRSDIIACAERKKNDGLEEKKKNPSIFEERKRKG